jgi:heme exporter protein D
VPSLKKQLIVGAAICGGAALALPFITPWMVWCAVGVALLPVVAWTIKTYKDEHTDHADTVRAIQEVKTKEPEMFKQTIAPILQDWHSDATATRTDDLLKQAGDI